MSKINYDKFIKYLVEHSASDEFKNALYAQGLYFDNDELKSIEYRPKFKIGDRITDGRWTYTVKDMDLFNNLYSLENDNGYKTEIVFSYIDKEYKLANIGTSTELTESEDEKIRKDLIEWFEEFPDKIWRGHYKKDVISWLEKQGEQKQEINNFDVLPGLYKCVHRMFDGTSDGRLLFEVGNVYKCLSKHDRAEFEVSYGHSVYLEDPVVCKHFIPFEKQDEQKPADEIGNYDHGKVLESLMSAEMKTPEESLGIDSDTYNKIVDECIYGEQKPVDKVGSKFKVGDWLVHNERKHIVKIINHTPFDCKVVNILGYHHTITNAAIENNYHLWTIQDAKDGDVLANNTIVLIVDHLGTFEHRPIIYSWYFANSEKFYGMGTSVPDRWEVKGFTPATKEQCNLLFQKMKEAGYEWDAEKKELSKRVIDEGKSEMDYCFTKMMNGEKVSPIWSEEDEEMRLTVLQDLQNIKESYPNVNVEPEFNWLKSLKDRYTWKPSDEQMKVLISEVEGWTKGCPKQKVLESLYNDLKNLK